ncbi:MAG TPA: transposase [Blastocatellia bacterium]|nr:transposase [Blastocatellia bacterium]
MPGKLRQDNAVSDVIRDMKAGSSGWQTRVFPELENSSWQRGYAAFTVSASLVEQVRRYNREPANPPSQTFV